MTQKKRYRLFQDVKEEFSEVITMYIMSYFALLELVENGEILDEDELLRVAEESKQAADDFLDFKKERFGEAEPELPDLDKFIVQGRFNWHLYHLYCAMYHSGRYVPYGDIIGIYEMYYTGAILKDMVA